MEGKESVERTETGMKQSEPYAESASHCMDEKKNRGSVPDGARRGTGAGGEITTEVPPADGDEEDTDPLDAFLKLIQSNSRTKGQAISVVSEMLCAYLTMNCDESFVRGAFDLARGMEFNPDDFHDYAGGCPDPCPDQDLYLKCAEFAVDNEFGFPELVATLARLEMNGEGAVGDAEINDLTRHVMNAFYNHRINNDVSKMLIKIHGSGLDAETIASLVSVIIGTNAARYDPFDLTGALDISYNMYERMDPRPVPREYPDRGGVDDEEHERMKDSFFAYLEELSDDRKEGPDFILSAIICFCIVLGESGYDPCEYRDELRATVERIVDFLNPD